MILSYTLILPISQLQTQQVITSQIRSHTEYLIHTNYFLCSLYSQNWWKIYSLNDGFNTISWLL